MKKLILLFLSVAMLTACGKAPENITVMKWDNKHAYTVEEKLGTKDQDKVKEYVELVKEIYSEKQVHKKMGQPDYIITHMTNDNGTGKHKLVVYLEGKALYVGENEDDDLIYPIDTEQEEKIKRYIGE